MQEKKYFKLMKSLHESLETAAREFSEQYLEDDDDIDSKAFLSINHGAATAFVLSLINRTLLICKEDEKKEKKIMFDLLVSNINKALREFELRIVK